MAIFKLEAKQDHIEKGAKSSDLVKALSEFVWNAVDANATEVSVIFEKNALGGLEAIIIKDNGTGITDDIAKVEFKNLGNSWKKNAKRTVGQRALHGKEGKGRFQFFSLAEQANWKTTYQVSQDFFDMEIDIKSSMLEECSISAPAKSKSGKTGTVVELSRLKGTFDWLSSNAALIDFTTRFAPYLMQYNDVNLFYNGTKVDPAASIVKSEDLKIGSVVCPNRIIDDLSLKVIEWSSHIESRKIHLGSGGGIVLGSQAANVVAPGFEYSAYANSAYFQEIAEANLLEIENLSDPDFVYLMGYIRDRLTDYFRKRMVDQSKGLIDELKNAGAYPYEGDPKDEVEIRERQVFDIATYAVSSYSRDFKKADNSLKKMTLTFLREAVRSNPDTLTHILREVVKLPKNRQDEFSGLLHKTELSNIISASSLIAGRITTLSILREIVFNPTHKRTIKERGQLDVLIRDNTWLFGENFHITLHEAGLSKVMNRVAAELNEKKARKKTKKPDGKTGRIDCFLGRSVPNSDPKKREYFIVELKRPSLVVGRKELNQLHDYVNALKAQSDFANTDTFWHFYLVTGEYSDLIKDDVVQVNRPPGLVSDNANSKVWVKTWAEIIRDSEARLNFVQEKLQIDVSDAEIEQQIKRLKSSFLNEEEQEA